jgi:hypothetical protein
MADNNIMIISFTGHRNKILARETLDMIYNIYGGDTWAHGGAVGFDTQISNFARAHGIKEIVIKPEYTKYSKVAPLIRNRKIVEVGEILIACYDGRKTGGTKYTIEYAKKTGKKVVVFSPGSH